MYDVQITKTETKRTSTAKNGQLQKGMITKKLMYVSYVLHIWCLKRTFLTNENIFRCKVISILKSTRIFRIWIVDFQKEAGSSRRRIPARKITIETFYNIIKAQAYNIRVSVIDTILIPVFNSNVCL